MMGLNSRTVLAATIATSMVFAVTVGAQAHDESRNASVGSTATTIKGITTSLPRGWSMNGSRSWSCRPLSIRHQPIRSRQIPA
jgi:hypothetical protein